MATPISPSVQDSLQTLDARVELNLLEVLAKSYGEGFIKAVEGMEAKPQIKKDDSRLLKEDVARMTRPIQDYNRALAGKVDEIARESFAAGKDDMEVARILRARIPEILNNEPLTIQRPGKRPVSFTAEEYADLVSNVVPYAVRNEGYIRGLKEAGADGWQWVAVGDERMCPQCGAKHGQVYGWDDAKPPAHPGCRCRPVFWAKPRTKEEIAESERIKAKALEEPWENGGIFDDEPLVEASYSVDEQVDAVYNYQDYGYRTVNDVLREIDLDKKSPELLKAAKSDIAKIDSAFASLKPLDKKIIVYRSDGAAISAEAFEKLGIDAEIKAITSGGTKRLKPEDILFNDIKPPSGSDWNEYLTTKLKGYEFEDLAYLSTSKTRSGGMKFLNGSSDLSPYGVQGFLELEVPEGVKVIDVDKFVGSRTNEAEFLLNRGNKIVIDNVSVEMMQGNTSRGDRIYLKYKAHLEPLEVKSITTTKSLISAGASPDEVAEALIDDILPKKMAYPGSKIERPKLDSKAIDLDSSEVVKKAVANEIAYMNGGDYSSFAGKGDIRLKMLAQENGFAELPTVVSESELDKIVAEGHRELWRGLGQSKPKEFTELFRSGDYFAGEGIYGNGIYTGTGEGAKQLAALYAPGDHGAVMRMAIDKDAKVITVTELKSRLEKSRFRLDMSSDVAFAASKVKKSFMEDPGRAAVVWGYDAIDAENGQFIILNRKAIYVQATDYTREDRAGW